MQAVEAHSISKTYRVYKKPLDRLKEAMLRKPFHEPVESLKDVSFGVPFGASLGIIGENGAGKSTLLKILAGTLTPTSGEVIARGRVAALLELGSGFHPEFSGRQNIYLNAALQGLTEAEIKEREAAILDFAELGKFIDRSLKTYSSGMVMRLAFSIATCINPDVLIVDEALSVGDQYFQKKCVDRMMRFRKGKKAVLFCSHSMYLLGELCEQTLWLENGGVREYGPTSEVSGKYLAYMEDKQETQPGDTNDTLPRAGTTPEVLIEQIQLLNEEGRAVEQMKQFGCFAIEILTRRNGTPVAGHLGVALNKPDGQIVFASSTKEAGLRPISFCGRQITKLVFPSLPLISGAYNISAVVTDQHALHGIHDRVTDTFEVSSRRPEFGMVWMEHEWRVPASSD